MRDPINKPNPTAKFASFNWMRGVARDKRISLIYQFILLRLCLYRDEKSGGQCNPGYQTVADEVGVYRTTALKAADAAVQLGWLAPPIRTRRANASFVFTFPNQEVATGATSNPDQEVAQQDNFLDDQEVALDKSRSRSGRVKKSLAERGLPAQSKPSTRNGQRERAKRTGSKNKIQSPGFSSRDSKQDAPAQDEQKASDIDAAFEVFWASAPSREDAKGGKEKTRKTYHMVVNERGVAPAKINAAMSRYAATRAGKDATFTKYPRNWLTDGYYNNEPPPGAGPAVIDNATGEPVAVAVQRPQNLTSWEQTVNEYLDDIGEEAARGKIN